MPYRRKFGTYDREGFLFSAELRKKHDIALTAVRGENEPSDTERFADKSRDPRERWGDAIFAPMSVSDRRELIDELS